MSTNPCPQPHKPGANRRPKQPFQYTDKIRHAEARQGLRQLRSIKAACWALFWLLLAAALLWLIGTIIQAVEAEALRHRLGGRW